MMHGQKNIKSSDREFKSPDLSQLQLIRPIIPFNGYSGASFQE